MPRTAAHLPAMRKIASKPNAIGIVATRPRTARTPTYSANAPERIIPKICDEKIMLSIVEEVRPSNAGGVCSDLHTSDRAVCSSHELFDLLCRCPRYEFFFPKANRSLAVCQPHQLF